MGAAELNVEFGIAGVLEFSTTEHGLIKAAVSLATTRGEFYLQGAHVAAWQPRGEDRPVLFTSLNSAFLPGRAIRGGIPVIFPWFGPNTNAPAAPQHGLARTAAWHLDAVERDGSAELALTFALGDRDISSPFWQEPFRATYTVVFGQRLSLRLAVQNLARQPIQFEEALHSYFAVSDIAKIAIGGLRGATYIDKTAAGTRKVQTASQLTIAGETDRVYLDTGQAFLIEDGGWRRRICIEKDGAASTVVWNPWAEKAAGMADLGRDAWRGMVCVETGNIADNRVRLAADGEHAMTTLISVDPIPGGGG